MIILKLDEKQEEKYRRWAATHKCRYRNKIYGRYVGCVGGADTFTITPTSIGDIASVKCLCGSELDLSSI